MALGGTRANADTRCGVGHRTSGLDEGSEDVDLAGSASPRQVAPQPLVVHAPSPAVLDPGSAPALDATLLFSGSGFQPGSVVVASDVGPTGVHPIDSIAVAQFQVRADGSFGPVDLTYSGAEEIGSHVLTFDDGVCEATYAFTIDG